MKNKFKILSLITILLIVVTMVGACGNTEQVGVNSEGNSSIGDEGEMAEEMVEIKVMILSLGAQGDGATAVEKKLNEITEKEINVHVTLNYVEPGQYSQQLNLAIAGSENLDVAMITPIPPAGFSALTSGKTLVPLNDLMEEYGQDTLDIVGEYVKGTSIDGTIYALPSYRDLSSGAYVIMRKDLLEEAGLLDEAEAMETWAEYESIMTKITEQFDINGTGSNDADGTVITIANAWLDGDDFSDASSFDSLGDSSRIIATDEDGIVVNYYKSDQYKEMSKRVRSWYEKGLVYKDSATSNEVVDTHLKTNVYFSAVITGELGTGATHSSASGKDIFAKKITGILTGTTNITKFGWAIPVCSKEHEAAAKFLDLMFKSEEVNNLLSWGIEGIDYVVKDGMAEYPEGITSETVAYHTSDFLYGNQFLVTPWEDSPEGIREVAKKEMEESGVSKYLGFSCDTTEIVNELTAVTNVVNEYKAGLDTGILGMEEYDEFIEKLEAAGAELVIAEYQKQLDEWISKQ